MKNKSIGHIFISHFIYVLVLGLTLVFIIFSNNAKVELEKQFSSIKKKMSFYIHNQRNYLLRNDYQNLFISLKKEVSLSSLLSIKVTKENGKTLKLIKPPFSNNIKNPPCKNLSELSLFNVLIINCFTDSETIYFDQLKEYPLIKISWAKNVKVNYRDLFSSMKFMTLYTIIFLIFYLYSMRKIWNIAINPVKKLNNVFHNLYSNNHFPEKNAIEVENTAPREIKNIVNNINNSIKKIITLQKKNIEHEKNSLKHEISKQVAHDIRSPLAALNMISKDLHQLPEETRLMVRESINRIKDIANNLIREGEEIKEKFVSTENCLIYPIIESVVSEKRASLHEHNNIKISLSQANTYGLFAKVEQSHLKRIISNLINNSIDAIESPTKGIIKIRIYKDKKNIKIEISDNGKGIPNEIIKEIGKKNFTFGKDQNESSGSGVGVYYAKKVLRSWEGSLSIESRIGKGTTVKISLPASTSPFWFIPEIILKENQTVIILDDDPTIHQIWDCKLKKICEDNNIKLLHFSSPEDPNVIEHLNTKNELCFLCDFEFLNNHLNGIDIIKRVSRDNSSILVTSRYNERNLKQSCEEFKIKLLPKMFVESISIKVHKNKTVYDLIHIDDDPLIRAVWKLEAKNAKKQILSCKNIEELHSTLSNIKKETLIYIDSELDGNTKGEDYAKFLNNNGYTNIYLTTGHSPELFKNYTFIKGIIGKDFPL